MLYICICHEIEDGQSLCFVFYLFVCVLTTRFGLPLVCSNLKTLNLIRICYRLIKAKRLLIKCLIEVHSQQIKTNTNRVLSIDFFSPSVGFLYILSWAA